MGDELTDPFQELERGCREYREYELALQAQMHFNEILMKYRSFAITVVVAVYSYAVTRPSAEALFSVGLTPSQVVAAAGIIITVLFAIIDLGYFLPLLIASVDRSLELEKIVAYRLTSTISNAVSKTRAYFLVVFFYVAVAFSGAVLVLAVLPSPLST